MIDADEPPASDAPKTEDAPATLGYEVPTNDTRSATSKTATPPLNKQSNTAADIKINQENVVPDGDSDAETLIESPEKRKLNIVEAAPRLQPTSENEKESGGEGEITSSQSSESLGRKRKRSDDESKDESHRPSSWRSSPLSSPVPDVQSGNEDEPSSRRRNASHAKSSELRRRDGSDKESKEADRKQDAKKPSGIKPQKRRKSEVEDNHTRPARRRHSPEGGGTERRETRSATYPRQESTERSLSPRPGREHKRITSVQSVQTLASHKTRRIPAPLNTRRHHSSDRSSEASNSPAPSRPHLHKFASADNDVTSPAKVMAKKLRDKHGRTLLAQACTDDKLDRVKQVYEERPQDLNIADNAGNTPLQIAALQGHMEIVEFLLEKNCEVNSRNIEKDTPLIDAVENGHIEVVKLLLDHGADPRLGNAIGQKPIELVDHDDEKIRKLLIDAKNKTVNRRQSEDQAPLTHPREGSSRAASAASPRDSPPVHGPKSPPPLQLSRRRAREQTRNDLLWQANTPENLTKLAGKGDTEGVVNILNILNKASPEALIAACKGGHDEVLQLLIAMGNPDPDPEPVVSQDQRRGYNTPMLAAIGEGNLQSVRLLAEQDGFNPTREFRGRTYYEIARERKGDDWEKESKLLQTAYDGYVKAHTKHQSPRKARDAERRRARGSSSPFSKRGKSPTRIQTDPHIRRDGRPNEGKRSDLLDSNSTDHTIAVSSDHDLRTSQLKSHKTRRSRSDAPHLNVEEEVRKKRRLISRREHMKGNSHGTEYSSGDEGAVRIKHETEKMPGKRRRSSHAAQSPQALDLARVKKRSRRALSDSSPEESRSAKKRMSSQDSPPDPLKEARILKDVDNVFQKSQLDQVHRTVTPEPIADEDDVEKARVSQELQRRTREAEERKEADRLRKIQEEQDAADRLAIQKEAERVRAEEEARQKAEEERLAVERKLAEEAAAKKKADEEALARKKEEEERQERLRREAEEKQRRAEERRQRILREHEQRRMEALPKLLCKSARLLDSSNPEAKSPDFLQKFLPLFTVKTRQIDPYCNTDVADEDWFPGFQAAPLLAAKNLGLEHFTHWEKRKVNDRERICLWKVARTMLIQGDDNVTALNMSIEQALQLDRETHPKFEAMQPLVWVKVSQINSSSLVQIMITMLTWFFC
jgi:ankyrin repeat protein